MSIRISSIFCLLLVYYIRFCESKGKLVILDDSNWSDIISNEWMVEFFAPWCPACKALTPVWKEFSEWSDDLGISVGEVDVTNNPGLSGRFMVTALPTIYHVKDGVFRQYRGPRDKEAFISFIEEKKWKSIDAIPGWKTPQSIQMSAVSYFFKLSMALRSIHTKIVEDFGVPYWVSYILFALATVVLGAILGLLVVCVIDIIFPQKSPEVAPRSSITQNNEEGNATEQESISDDDDNVIDDTASAETSSDLRQRRLGAGDEISD